MNTPENDLIRKILGKSSRTNGLKPGLRLGIGDDAALFAPRSGYETILTCDWFLERTHFLRDRHPADSVGWKSLARAASDVAAMGGTPRCFLLSLAIPRELTGRWLTDFLTGLRRASRKLHCPIAGGDTTRQNRVLINVTVVGEVRNGMALLRSGARPGDIIYVSGRLGEADLGLSALRSTRGKIRPSDPMLHKHLYPEPRIPLGQWLAEHRLATAAMDLSDGLSTDLARLCAASKAGATIDESKLASAAVEHPSVPKWNKRLALALNGGDDYELLFTVRPSKARKLPRTFEGILLTPIGEITKNNTTHARIERSNNRLEARRLGPLLLSIEKNPARIISRAFDTFHGSSRLRRGICPSLQDEQFSVMVCPWKGNERSRFQSGFAATGRLFSPKRRTLSRAWRQLPPRSLWWPASS